MAEYRLTDFFKPQQVHADCAFSTVDQVAGAEQGSLVYAATVPFVESALENPNVSALIVPESLAGLAGGKGLVVAEDPRQAFFDVYVVLQSKGHLHPRVEPGIGDAVQIAGSAIISPLAQIGDRVVIEDGVVVGDYCVIQSDSRVGPNAVIGAEGLMPIEIRGKRSNLPFGGHVEIGEDVTILAGAVVVKSVFRKPTAIGCYSSVGIRSSIGHDTQIGRNVLISANCVLSGGCRVDDDAQIWSSSSIAQGLSIGTGAEVLMGSVVVSDLPAGARVSGNYAVSHRKRIAEIRRKK